MVTGPSQMTTSITALRMIIGAMIFGIVSFAVIVFFVGRVMAQDPSLTWIFTGVLALLGAVELVAYTLARAGFAKAAKTKYEQSDGKEAGTERVLQMFASLAILRSAMAEGFGLAGLVFLLITGSTLLWLAPIISVAVLAMGMPSQEKASEFFNEVTGANPYAG